MSGKAGLRAELIQTAVDLLERGESDPSLRHVAREAGVSAMAPYRHFADKDALLRAVAEHGFALLHQTLATADSSADGSAALLEQGIAYVAFAERHPALFRLMFKGHCKSDAEDDLGMAGYDVLARRVALLSPADPQAAILACRAIVHGLATLALDGETLEPERTRAALGLLVAGLTPANPGSRPDST